jgi:hypothetical protein
MQIDHYGGKLDIAMFGFMMLRLMSREDLIRDDVSR